MNYLLSIEVKNRDDPLMITPHIYEQNFRGTLIYNGSTLNICGVGLLDKINSIFYSIQPNPLYVCGFDNIPRESLGIVILPYYLSK